MPENTEQLLVDTLKRTASALEKLQQDFDGFKTETKNLGDASLETKKKVDEALIEFNASGALLKDLEQKMATIGAGGAQVLEHKSVGQQLIETEEYKAMQAKGAGWRGTQQFELKNLTTADTSGGRSVSTSLIQADRQGLVWLPDRTFQVRGLLAPGTTNSNAIEYARETVFTNAAAMVAENPTVAKPQSDIKFDMANTGVKTLAHFMKASKQIMADAPQLQSYVDNRLRYGLDFVEDAQLLNGDGTGNNLLGLIPQSTPYADPAGVAPVAGRTNIDTLRLAMLQAALALYPATGMVMHDVDWTNIELSKDTQNRYLFANLQGTVQPTLWGLPVVKTLSMTPGKFLVGAFKYAAQIFDREDTSVMISTEDQDNFVKNMVTILAEKRLALAVYRPQAIIYGDFAAALAAAA